MNNMELWGKVKAPPPSALKQIKGGRLNGMTDISPQWRYKILTEIFGVCGVGWKYTVESKWIEEGAKDERFAFVDILLYIKHNGEWSDAIPGTGGHKLVVSEKNGLHNNDEAFKMATTDALSTAMKLLGVGADIYAGKYDGSKYNYTPEDNQPLAGWSAGTFSARLGQIKKGFEAAGIVNVFNENLEANYQTKDPVEIVKNHLDKAETIIDGLTKAYHAEVK